MERAGASTVRWPCTVEDAALFLDVTNTQKAPVAVWQSGRPQADEIANRVEHQASPTMVARVGRPRQRAPDGVEEAASRTGSRGVLA